MRFLVSHCGFSRGDNILHLISTANSHQLPLSLFSAFNILFLTSSPQKLFLSFKEDLKRKKKKKKNLNAEQSVFSSHERNPNYYSTLNCIVNCTYSVLYTVQYRKQNETTIIFRFYVCQVIFIMRCSELPVWRGTICNLIFF